MVLDVLEKGAVGHVALAHRRIGVRREDEDLERHLPRHVVADHDRRAEDLAAAGVDVGAHAGVARERGHIVDAVVAEVLGAELRVLLGRGERPDADGVLETDGLEALVPLEDALRDGGAHLRREGRVDVEYHGRLGFHGFAAVIGRLIRRLHAPAGGEVDGVHQFVVRVVVVLAQHVQRQAEVGQTRTHRRLGQQGQRTHQLGGGHLVVGLADLAVVGDVAGDGGVVLESGHVGEHRAVLLLVERDAAQHEFRLRTGVDGRQQALASDEQVGHVEHHGRGVGVEGLDLVRPEDRRHVALGQCAADLRAVVGHDRLVAVTAQQDRAVDRVELDLQRTQRRETDVAVGVVGDLGHRRHEHHVAVEHFQRQLDEQFVVDDVQGHHAALRGFYLLAFKKFVVFALLLCGCGGRRLGFLLRFLALGEGCRRGARQEQQRKQTNQISFHNVNRCLGLNYSKAPSMRWSSSS